MKLISCHIENFGKISNRDFNFNSDLTSFCEANGYGKTTLASFLKAMFYGLDSDRANAGFNERRHFNPFGGGNFGGHVTFLWQGKTFKIERYFDEKSEVKDSVTVYCNGALTPEYGGDIGEKIFEIDKESFERTVFITGAEIEISSTGSINTKLNNFLEGGGDDANLEAALARLDSRSKEYKKRQGLGLIQLESGHINDLSEKISNLRTIEAGLPAKYARLDGINRTIKELNENISEAQSVNVVLKDWEHYDSLIEEANKRQAEIKEIEGRYPFGMPSGEEIERLSSALERDKTLRAQGLNKQFTDEDTAKFSALQIKFQEGVPEDAVLNEIEKAIAQSNELSHDINTLSGIQPTEREGMLRHKFAYHTPTQEEISELDRKAENYKEAEKKYTSLPDFVASETVVPAEGQKQRLSKLFITLLTVSAWLIIGGVATIFFQLIAGIVLLALGIVLLAVSGFAYLNKKTNVRSSASTLVQTENPQKAEAARVKDGILNEIQAFLLPYGYTLGNGVAFAVATFKEDLKSYSEILKTAEDKEGKLKRNTEEKQALDSRISSFFNKYGAVGDTFVGKLSALRTDICSFKSLKSRKLSSSATEDELQQKISENRIHIDVLCNKYRIDSEAIGEKIKFISNDCTSLQNAKNALNEVKERAEEFKENKQLGERPQAGFTDIRELNEQLSKAQDDKNSLFTEIKSDESQVEKLEDLKNEREAAKEKLEEYKNTHSLLLKTMESLKQADRNLKDKYVKPIKEQFVYYSALLEKTLGEKITMDANFEIRFERNGRERSEKHLSSGQRSICALCFRLALIDNMYAEEKPFLILDDPFASLDEEHIEKVKILLGELSKKMQIVYLVCHGSRAL